MSPVDFASDVFAVVRKVPKGRVTTYGAVANCLVSKKSSRRVGWVLNKSFSAFPAVPAHRVVNRLGQLTGAIHFPKDRPMSSMLEAEAVQVQDSTVLDFKALFWDPMTEL